MHHTEDWKWTNSGKNQDSLILHSLILHSLILQFKDCLFSIRVNHLSIFFSKVNHLDFLTPSIFPLLPCFFYFPPLTYCIYSSASLDQFLKPQKRHLLLKLDLLLSGSLKVNNGTLSPNNNHYFPPNVPETLLKCSTIAPYRQFTSVKGHLQVQYLKICHKEL